MVMAVSEWSWPFPSGHGRFRTDRSRRTLAVKDEDVEQQRRVCREHSLVPGWHRSRDAGQWHTQSACDIQVANLALTGLSIDIRAAPSLT